MAISSVDSSTVVAAEPTSGAKSALAMVMTLFFLWGFITCLNDILIPHLKSVFTLNYAEVMLVQTFFFSAYFVFALPSGKVIDWIGYKRTMVSGLLIMAVGALCFIPAASVPSFPLFLVALAIVAAGMTFLQVSANPYVIVLGPAKTGSSRLNLAGAFNSFGTTIAPYIGSLFILGTVPLTVMQLRQLSPPAFHAYQLQQAGVVKFPYFIIAVILVSFAVAMALYKLPKIQTYDTQAVLDALDAPTIWQQRHLLLAVVAIFVYVGAEVSIGSFLVNYLSQPEIGNMTEKTAAIYVTFYWGSAMIGRLGGAGITQKLRAGPVLGVAAVIAFCLVVTSMLSFGHLAMWSLILVGLFNSIMWPNIFALGLAELGRLTNQGSSLMVAAIIGGAILPLLQGIVADHIGIHHAFFIPALCYVYLCFFGFKGSNVKVYRRATV
ncbi:MAG TPA: sugar MFS transporter [Acidobacteriaceae bacterium]|jgi:FHS family L-fucose permease-like MFS transporter|nr:sugar MFS transporter [Acidobacteriaceae bacterium]